MLSREQTPYWYPHHCRARVRGVIHCQGRRIKGGSAQPAKALLRATAEGEKKAMSSVQSGRLGLCYQDEDEDEDEDEGRCSWQCEQLVAW